MPKNTALDPRGSVSPRTTIESKETAASRKSSHHDSKKSTGEIKIQLKLDYDSPKSSNLMTIETAIDRFADELADYEYEEMQQYKDIYFVGKLCSKLQKLDKHSKNFGWDDKKGFYLLKTQDHLKYRYEVLSVIGNGSFGVVYKCLDWKTKEEYAVKILRNKEKFHKQGRIEIDILKVLNATSKKEAQFVVEMKDSFVFRNHICIVFEMLSIDLYQLIKVSKFSVFI
jgi:dual specificity tyrosine-phosphorylation-regulated kinase 2/3/4